MSQVTLVPGKAIGTTIAIANRPTAVHRFLRGVNHSRNALSFLLAIANLPDNRLEKIIKLSRQPATGLEMGLGRTVNVAKNRSPQAISTHTVNHPGAQHFTTHVFEGDPDTKCGGKGQIRLLEAIKAAGGDLVNNP